MFRVAGRLGMTVAELGARMGGDELIEWAAFFELEAGNRVIRADRESLLTMMRGYTGGE